MQGIMAAKGYPFIPTSGPAILQVSVKLSHCLASSVGHMHSHLWLRLKGACIQISAAPKMQRLRERPTVCAAYRQQTYANKSMFQPMVLDLE